MIDLMVDWVSTLTRSVRFCWSFGTLWTSRKDPRCWVSVLRSTKGAGHCQFGGWLRLSMEETRIPRIDWLELVSWPWHTMAIKLVFAFQSWSFNGDADMLFCIWNILEIEAYEYITIYIYTHYKTSQSWIARFCSGLDSCKGQTSGSAAGCGAGRSPLHCARPGQCAKLSSPCWVLTSLSQQMEKPVGETPKSHGLERTVLQF